MTAQIHDTVIYQNEPYETVGIKGVGLVTPQQFGMTTYVLSTACWRGYYSQYTVERGDLYLTEMAIGCASPVPIQGILPSRPERHSDPTYQGLKLPVPYQGQLLIGRDFIRDLYDHAGFQQFFKFQTVFELTFENGKLIQFADHSAKASALRSQLAAIEEERDNALRRLNGQHQALRLQRDTLNTNNPKYAALTQQMDTLDTQMAAVRDKCGRSAARIWIEQSSLPDYSL